MSVELIHVNSPTAVSKYNRMIKDKPTMVLFYMDGCGHCENMKPEWGKFEENAENTNMDRVLARVNANYIGQIDGDTDVIGYPTIMGLINGKKHREFTGKRTQDEFMKFLEDQSSEHIGGNKKRHRRKSSKKSKKYIRKSRKRTRRSKRKRRTRRSR